MPRGASFRSYAAAPGPVRALRLTPRRPRRRPRTIQGMDDAAAPTPSADANHVTPDGELPELVQASNSARSVDPTQSVAGHAARGAAWVTGARLLTQVAQFGASLVLARLLSPDAYGLTAVVWTFTGFAFLFNDLGLGASLVQSDAVTDDDLSTAFWINALAGLLLTALLFALSGPLAAASGQPAVRGLLQLASLAFTLSLSTVPTALLERRMLFRLVGAIDIGAAIIGLTVSVAAAASGLGARSLVLGPLAMIVYNSVAATIAARWLPRFRFTRVSARRLLAFGSHLSCAGSCCERRRALSMKSAAA